MKKLTGLHVLLSARRVGDHSPIELARMAVNGGASVIQFREKQLPTSELLTVGIELRNIARDITFIVNDRVDIAVALEADGVHLGQEDLPIGAARQLLEKHSTIGISCGSYEEAIEAEMSGANYIGFGHMYPTTSKEKPTPPKSIQELTRVVKSIKIPVIAIGGITLSNIQPIISAGTAGAAVISAFSDAEDPRDTARKFSCLIHG